MLLVLARDSPVKMHAASDGELPEAAGAAARSRVASGVGARYQGSAIRDQDGTLESPAIAVLISLTPDS